MEHCGGVFGMELCANEPGMISQFHHLYQFAGWVGTHAVHAVGFKFGEVVVVEFVAVAMAFADVRLSIDGTRFAALL